MVAPRRMLAHLMSRSVENVYSYRWDVAALNTSTTIGVQHFAEVTTNIELYMLFCNFLETDFGT